jgi:hypothetical protein
MKSVVMIAYAFPPEGNAGAYRPLRFVRHLPALGWQPTIITLETDSFERYDASLLGEVPKELEVIRVRNRDPWQAFLAKRSQRIKTQISQAAPVEAARILGSHQKPTRARLRELVRSFEAWVYHPDIAMGWIAPAVRAVEQACKRVRAEIIWATAGPVSSFHVAERASRHTGVPYVLDFRDAWTITFNEFEDRRPVWARQRDRRNMFRFLKGAQAVIFRYDTEAECYCRAYHGALEPSKIRIIPNGFEGEVESFTASKGRKCEILYTGTLSDYRYDTLLDAIGALKRSFPEEAARLHLHFVGEGTRAIEDRARVLDLTEIITAEAAIPHGTVIQLSKQADALLLLGRPPAMKGYELFAAAKLFGYLKAGRPIVGVLPADEAKLILQHVGVSTVADVNSVADIVAVLRRVLRRWADGTLESLLPDLTACRAYSAERQTQTLVSAFEGAPSLESFVPGKVAIPDSLQKEIGRREEVYKRETTAISLQTYSSSSRP